MMTKRYLLFVLGTPDDKLTDDLQEIANEQGVYFIEGKGVFICTFYTDYNVDEIYEFLSYSSAIMVFDISEQETFAINLPPKYHLALFPEIKQVLDGLNEYQVNDNKKKTKKEKIEEFQSIDDILDKLSKNNYDRSCLTESELDILKNQS
jgi:hypothetical protein